MNKFLPMLVLILLCGCPRTSSNETSSNNFVANASFSGKDESGRPLQFAGYSPSGALQVKAHNGIITVSKVADGTLSLMYPTQVVPIRPNKRYRISVEISTEKLISYVFPEAQIVALRAHRNEPVELVPGKRIPSKSALLKRLPR